MGDRANAMDRPGGPHTSPITDAEISRVASVVGEAVAAGAVGFSTSRTLLHRDTGGVQNWPRRLILGGRGVASFCAILT